MAFNKRIISNKTAQQFIKPDLAETSAKPVIKTLSFKP